MIKQSLKTLLALFVIGLAVSSCKDEKENGKFTLTGEIKNAPDQQVYLEQLYFSDKSPEVLDTAEIKNGRFTVGGIAAEEGLFRIRLEKNEGGFYFINDNPAITFKADVNNADLAAPVFDTKANAILKRFLLELEAQRKVAVESTGRMEALRTAKNNDSAVAAEVTKQNALRAAYTSYISAFIDTTSDPVVAMFALGYTQGMDPKEIQKIVPGLVKRFPAHQGMKALIARVNTMIAGAEARQQPAATPIATGSMAPEITMPDENGKPFSLSRLKGKYVLVDFWASWCRPCRGENPNIVAAYNKYKNKNFTILGVSLDEKKEDWLAAVKDDRLSWKQVSDLKGWKSAAVKLYGFDAIPYNVLIDPEGRIIATELREGALPQKLEEVLGKN
jgi:peroxiredoxin